MMRACFLSGGVSRFSFIHVKSDSSFFIFYVRVGRNGLGPYNFRLYLASKFLIVIYDSIAQLQQCRYFRVISRELVLEYSHRIFA
jgi:hypothetical protein